MDSLVELVQGLCCPRVHGCEVNDAEECPAQRVKEALVSLQRERDEARDQAADATARWCARMAEVREASGVGHKPMLDEVPAAIRARFEEIEALATRAEAQRDALAEALRFYAEPISYIATQAREPRTAVNGDEGKRARQALTSLSPAKDEDPTHD